jgi:predicted nucleotidyltransferase
MKSETEYISALIRKAVSAIDPKAEVVLYGSRARGDERKDSDWDILILTDYTVDLQIERKFREGIYELELETGEPFSVFVYSKHEWYNKQKITPYYQNVIREGIFL